MYDEYMKMAIEEAEIARTLDEVPIGAVIVKDDEVIARAHNLRETMENALYHAELTVIDEACRRLHAWRLTGCTLYVTLEPCAMCAGCAVNARIDRIVYGAKDLKSGACGSVLNVPASGVLNHKIEVVGGVCEEECRTMLKQFFKSKREKNNMEVE